MGFIDLVGLVILPTSFASQASGQPWLMFDSMSMTLTLELLEDLPELDFHSEFLLDLGEFIV